MSCDWLRQFAAQPVGCEPRGSTRDFRRASNVRRRSVSDCRFQMRDEGSVPGGGHDIYFIFPPTGAGGHATRARRGLCNAISILDVRPARNSLSGLEPDGSRDRSGRRSRAGSEPQADGSRDREPGFIIIDLHFSTGHSKAERQAAFHLGPGPLLDRTKVRYNISHHLQRRNKWITTRPTPAFTIPSEREGSSRIKWIMKERRRPHRGVTRSATPA